MRSSDGHIRVLLCDDHDMVRTAIAGMLSYLPDIEVVGEASEGARAIELARSLKPDLIVMDLAMPGMDGFEAMARIRIENEEVRILVLTGTETSANVSNALEEGADGYIVKDAPRDELFRAIRDVASGVPYISPAAASHLFRLYQTSPKDTLTSRETEMLCTIAEGKTDKEISVVVRLSERTVKNHVATIRKKLSAVDRTNAVAVAAQRGLIRVNDNHR